MNLMDLQNLLHFKAVYLKQCGNCNGFGCAECDENGTEAVEEILTISDIVVILDEYKFNPKNIYKKD